MNRWLAHVKQYHKKHPSLSYSEALKRAKSSYKKDPKSGEKQKARSAKFFAMKKKGKK